MKLLSFISFVILLYSCSDIDQKKLTIKPNNDTGKNTFNRVSECIQRDTITQSGTSIHYIDNNGKFQITWGDNNYNRTYDSLFMCNYDTLSGVWDFVPKYNSESTNTLVFTNIMWTSSGGNPAPLEFSAIVFPKNITDSVYEKEFFINSMGGYLIYGDIVKDETIHIMNLETKKTQNISLNPKPAISRSPTLSIQYTKIESNTFSVRYETINKNEDVITFIKKFQLKI